jgi:hypothetical protein
VFILLEFRSPSRRIFIGSHSLPPLWFAVSVLQRPLPLTHGVASGVGRKTPKGLVVGALGLWPRPTFESRGRGRQGESPNLPWLDRPGGRGGAGFPRASQVAGA